MAASDLTKLLRLFHLMERALSQFLNAARTHEVIDSELHKYMNRERNRTVTALVSSEDIHEAYPNDLILFLEERIAAAEMQIVEGLLQKNQDGARDEFFKLLRAANNAKADKFDDGAAEEGWKKVIKAVSEGLKGFRKQDHLPVDKHLLDKHPEGKSVTKAAVPRWAWRYTRRTISDFIFKLEFLLNSRNTVMHGNDLKLATFDVVVETLADVFSSIRALLGQNIALVPDGHIFSMGPLEIVRFSEEAPLEETPDIKVSAIENYSFIATSFNLGGARVVGNEIAHRSWPTKAEASKVWVSKGEVRSERVCDKAGDKASINEEKWNRFSGELIQNIKKVNVGDTSLKYHVSLSRYRPDIMKSHPYSPLRWVEAGENELYVCFWQSRLG